MQRLIEEIWYMLNFVNDVIIIAQLAICFSVVHLIGHLVRILCVSIGPWRLYEEQ